MSLVDVRAPVRAVDCPGPGVGPGAGCAKGCAGRGPLESPVSSPLASPLDSPLGSPLGAVSLDAAVFVAKGGLNAAILDDSDPRADSFADACSQPSLAQPPTATPTLDPEEPTDTSGATPASPADFTNHLLAVSENTDDPQTSHDLLSSGQSLPRTARSTGRETRSSVASLGRETVPTRSIRETRSTAVREVESSATYETRSTRLTRRTRRNSTLVAEGPPPLDEERTPCPGAGTEAEEEPPDDTSGETRPTTPGETATTRTALKTAPTATETESTAPSAVIPISATAATTPSECSESSKSIVPDPSTPGTSNTVAPPDSVVLADGDANCATEGAPPSPEAAPRTATQSVPPCVSEGVDAMSVTPSEKVDHQIEQAPAVSATPIVVSSPRFLPNIGSRLSAQMSTEVTDALGRKNCLLPSLPRKARAISSSSPPGGILSRALTGGLSVKLPAKTSDCVNPKLGAPGRTAMPMGILARTLSAPADLLPTSSEAASHPARTTATTPTPASLLTSIITSKAPHPILATQTTSATLVSVPSTLVTSAKTTVPTLSKTILLNPILSKALSPSKALTQTAVSVGTVWSVATPKSASPTASTPSTPTVMWDMAMRTTQPASLDSDVEDAPQSRSISSPSVPSLAALASLPSNTTTGEDGDSASKNGLSDSCASSSSLSTVTSPGMSCAPCAPCVPPSLGTLGALGTLGTLGTLGGLDSIARIAVPEQASTAPLFTDSPDDLIDVADALNVLGAGDDDAVGSSQDSTQLSGGSSSSISSCCSGTSSCSGTTNFSMSINGGCTARQRPRAVSPSRLGPQQCQVCAKIFSNASALAKHKLTHSDERRYVCSVCNKAFKRQDHLNGHMLTHRNKKPFECVLEGCNKSYCDARSLRRHEENHHHVKPQPALRDVDKQLKKKKLSNEDGSGIEMCAKSLDSLPESIDPEDGVCQLGSVTSSTATTGTLSSPTDSGALRPFEAVPDSPHAGLLKKPVAKSASTPQFSSMAAPKMGVSQAPLIIPSVSTAPVPAQGGIVFASASTALTTAVQSPSLPSPIRIPHVPAPPPISIPSVRPQLLKTRVVSSKAVQNISQTTNNYGQVQDQSSIPHSPTTSANLKQSSQESASHSNFLSSFISPSQQIVHIAISQPSAVVLSSNQSQITQAMSVQANRLPSGQGIQVQSPMVLSLSGKTVDQADNQSRAIQSPTWAHMVVTSTSNEQIFADSAKRHALQPPVVTTSGQTIVLHRQTSTEMSVGTSQQRLNNTQQMPAGSLQQNPGRPISSPQIKPTVMGGQLAMAWSRVQCEQQIDALQDLKEQKDIVPALASRAPTRILSAQPKKAQPKPGLDIPAASTSNCAPVSTPTTTTTTTSTASTIAFTINTTKVSSSPVLITSNGIVKTSTHTSSSGISSSKVSSTAHLGSVRGTQVTSGAQQTQQSRQTASSSQEEAKKDSKAAAAAAAAAAANSAQSKPVACTLCNRRFKNIPALNGHMRLHGGFFKKESEAKRSDKRESTGPPLQTASVSVRQLIEEKIIQKRGGVIGRTALLAGRDSGVSSSSSRTPSSTTASNAASPALVHSREMLERRRHSDLQESNFRKVTMASDSVTTVLQHHNYANSSFPTPPTSGNVSNANTPPPPVPSPLTCASFLPLSPQSDGSEPHQLLIHSEDPLLSSTIKDITRKKIDLGSLTVLGSLLVERGGELHLIQAPTAIVQKLSGRNTKQGSNLIETPVSFTSTVQNISTPTNVVAYQTSANFFKAEEIEDEVFLNPSIVPDSPLSLSSPAGSFSATSRSPLGSTPSIEGPTSALSMPISISSLCPPPAKRPRLSKPYPAYKSRLRSCRREAICSASMPYTPAPLLDPNRSGNGLIAHAGSPWHCSSTTVDGEDSCDAMAISAPESDSFPHVNVGTRFQCPIPPFERKPYEPGSQDYLLWEPAVTSKCTEEEVDAYLEFACCDAIPWGGRNQEYALHVLHMCDGDIQEAMVQLMQWSPTLPPEHLLLSYNYGVTDVWNEDEMDTFVNALSKHFKNWTLVANEVGTKNAKECVQFYYLWKKLCPDEYYSVKTAWKTQARASDDMNNNLNIQVDAHSKGHQPGSHNKDKTETQAMALLHANTVNELAAYFSSSSDVEDILNMNRQCETLNDVGLKEMSNQFIFRSSNESNDLLNCNALVKIPTNLKQTSSLKDKKNDQKSEALAQFSQDVSANCHNLNDISQNFDQSLECLKASEEMLLNEIKQEPWEFSIKEEIKQELDGSNFDMNDTKTFITEFNNIKLNQISKTSADLQERVEDAPIIVAKSASQQDDTNDQVKIEIESMMALHGIRVEDDPNSVVINDGPDQTGETNKHPSGPGSMTITEEHVSTSSDSRLFVCELTDCSASFNSRAALNGHIRIHGYRKSPPPSLATVHRMQRQEFPCETCGKIFAKLKSRNAHMKTHKQSSADLAETLAGQATGISSSADAPSTATSTGLTFSTCLSFGLAVDTGAIHPSKDDSDEISVCEEMNDAAERNAGEGNITIAARVQTRPDVDPGDEVKIRLPDESSSFVDGTLSTILSVECSLNNKSEQATLESLSRDSTLPQDVIPLSSVRSNVRSDERKMTSTTFTGRVAVSTANAHDHCLQHFKSTKSSDGLESRKGIPKSLKLKPKTMSTLSALSRSK